MKPIRMPRAKEGKEVENRVMPKALASPATHKNRSMADTVIDQGPTVISTPGTFQNFEGVDNQDGVLPPDTNGDVGPNHYVQTVNLSYQIFDKSGNSLLGPINTNTLWSGFGGACENQNNGDPIGLYDHLEDRWLISQFALFAPDGNHHQCIAISETGDPTGAYHRYDFIAGTTNINDYPHFGVWPDGYYMTINQFNENTFAWGGAGVFAFERDKMLEGQPAQLVYFDLFGVDDSFGGMLPSDLDGPPPTSGAPNVFLQVDDESVFGTDRISLWNFHVDWDVPANSTFGNLGQPDLHMDTAPFDWDLCGFSRSCIPQPNTSQGLDAISDRLMYSVQYRNFGAYSTLVLNHTVDVDDTDHAGIRWYELRNDGSGWEIFQQGTWAPDGDHRWMGSISMDSAGNIALGYSVSGDSTFPSIRYAGRLVSDPAGDLSQGETSLIEGTGNQTHPAARWGDYSRMSVDPSSGSNGGIDCDFWYTTEYIQNSGSADWQTRVGAFTFSPAACGGPHGDLQGHVTDSSNSNPIQGAKVSAGGFTTTTDANGFYHFTLGVGTYDVTASAYGYFSQTHTDIEILEDGTTTEDFDLDVAPQHTVSGTVTDGSGHGWPMYARIDITGYPFGPIYTNPITGQYSVQLVEATPYTFHVNAISAGYNVEHRAVTPPASDSIEDFALTVNNSTCSAPGYGIVGGLSEDFEGGSTPAGWSITTNGEDTNVEWHFDDPCSRGNLTGGDGGFAIADSDCLDAGGEEDTELQTPVLDFSSQAVVFIEFDTDFLWYSGGLDEKADVDVSTDGGGTWTNVKRYQGGDARGPRHESIDVSGIAGNEANVVVRFHFYESDFEFWWQIDNVKVGATCAPITGGLLVGNVYDGNTGTALNGASVASKDAPADTTLSFATPQDDDLDDGFYILFSSLTGNKKYTSTKANYGVDTQNVSVSDDSLNEQDFTLEAGRLTPDPTLLENTVALGTQSTLNLALINDGAVDVDYEIQEGKNFSNAPQPALSGAPVKRIAGNFSPLSMTAVKQKRTKIAVEEREVENEKERGPNAPPWIAIADYPSDIMDNTCAELDGLIYCAGGFDGFENLNTAQVYNPGGNAWSEIAAMSEVREKPVVAAIDGKLYVTGGWDSNGTPSPVLEIYDPAGDAWTTGASIPTAYAASTGVNLDGKFYVIGGCDASCGVTDVQVYDPAGDSWTTAADYPEDTSWLACGAIGGQIYCAGGTATGESQATYTYDPGADAWTQLADMPQTQWGMGYVVSDDLLYISGGVTDNFNTVTNEGFVYDPGADSWTAIANSNNTVYRGGSACGLYKIGGSVGGFSPVADAEVFPGLSNCGGAVDVPWLSEDPAIGNVAKNHTDNIDVIFDASQVTQPGEYYAHLRIKEDTPYNTEDVQVHMTVPLPAGWGYLEGTVTGMGRCDVPGEALKGASVFIDTTGTDWDLVTDVNGYFKVAFLAGTSTVTVTINGYITEVRPGVTVTDGNTTTEDFDLRRDTPCLDVVPTELEDTVELGNSSTKQFTISNTGAGEAEFVLTEGEGLTNGPQPSHKGAPLMRIKGQFTPLSSNIAKGKFGGSSAPQAPNDLPWTDIASYPDSIMDNTCAEIDGLLYCVGGFDGGNNTNAGAVYNPETNDWTSIASMTGIREKPVVAAIDGLLYVTGGWDANGTPDPTLEIYDPSGDSWTTGASIPTALAASTGVNLDGLFYVIGGCDFECGFTDVQVYDPSGDSWTSVADYPEPTSWVGCGAIGGQIYCAGGVASGESEHTYVYDPGNDQWTQLADMPQTQWAMGYVASDDLLYISGGVTDDFNTVTNEGFVYDPSQDLWNPIENSNNSLYRGGSGCGFYKVGGSSGGFSPVSDSEVYPELTNCGAAADVVWLSEDPVEGTVIPDTGTQVIDVTMDAAAITQPGDYLGHVKIRTAYSIPDVQVTMHVPLPLDWGTLQGTVTGMGRCDVPGNPLKKAIVSVDTNGNDWELETDASGNYKVSFPIADGPVTISVSKDGYVSDSVSEINVNHATPTTQDFDLRLDAPCGDKTPTSFEVFLNSGDTSTETLSFTNDGAGALEFLIRETTFPLNPLRPQLTKAEYPKVPHRVEIGPLSVRNQGAKPQKSAGPVPSNAWFLGLPVPGGLVRYAHAQCDDQPNSFYVFAGVDGNFSITSNAWRFDADTGLWNALAAIPSGVEGPTATCYQGRIYVLGGDGSTQHYIYDIATDTWLNGALLPRPVWGAVAGAWNGQVYMIGGDADFFGSGTSDEVNVYDIALDEWTGTATSMPVAAVTPGFFQAGPYLYMVGGWDDAVAPSENIAATQRYDMSTDTWTTGPDLINPRADLALAMTDTALYAMGGDQDGSSFFDASDVVERLEWADWPNGEWVESDSPMPTPYTGNNAGFCTQAIAAGSETWSLGGISPEFSIDGTNFFQPSATEHCFTIYSDVLWLSELPDNGSVSGDDSGTVDIQFDATGLEDGDYNAVLVVRTNDLGAAQFNIPVTMHVTGGGGGGCLFCDDFDDLAIGNEWQTGKGLWTEPAQGLQGIALRKGSIIADGFVGCQECTIDAEMQTGGGFGNTLWLLGWYVDKNNAVELLMKQGSNKWKLRQRSNGVIVAKGSATPSSPLQVNTVYHVTLSFDGSQIQLTVDGEQLITMNPGGTVQTGTVGFQVKATTGTFGMIEVN